MQVNWNEKDLKRLQFYRNLIKEKLDSIREDIGDLKYRLYLGVVNECDDYDELREMAELDMHIEFIEYIRKNILSKLQEDGISLEDLRNYYYGASEEGDEAEALYSNIMEADDSYIAFMTEVLNGRMLSYEDEDIEDEGEDIEIDESSLDYFEESEREEEDIEVEGSIEAGEEFGESEEEQEDIEVSEDDLYIEGEESKDEHEDVEVSENNEGEEEEFFVGSEEDTEEDYDEAEEDKLDGIDESRLFIEDEDEGEGDDYFEGISEDDLFVESDEEEVEDSFEGVSEDDLFIEGEDDEEVEDSSEDSFKDISEDDLFIEGDEGEEGEEEDPFGEVSEDSLFIESDEEEEEDIETGGINLDELYGDEEDEVTVPKGIVKSVQAVKQAKPSPSRQQTVFKDPRAQSVLDFMHMGIGQVFNITKTRKGKNR